MKPIILHLALLQVLAYPIATYDDKLTLLSSKVELYLQEKGWYLEGKLVWDGVVYHYWRGKQGLIKLSFFYLETEQGAAERMQKDIAGIRTQFGQGIEVEGIGDEGYERAGLKGGRVLVNVRKARVIVAVVAQSAEAGREMGKRVAELLAESLAARIAA